jgi:hypothetical protein
MNNLIETKPNVLRKARLGYIYDGAHRINVVFDNGRVIFNRKHSRKATSVSIPLLELYHASVGQLPLLGMDRLWQAVEIVETMIPKRVTPPEPAPSQPQPVQAELVSPAAPAPADGTEASPPPVQA